MRRVCSSTEAKYRGGLPGAVGRPREGHSLEHCRRSFPGTGRSQATQTAGLGGALAATNWWPLFGPPGFSFPSFTSFTFTYKPEHGDPLFSHATGADT